MTTAISSPSPATYADSALTPTQQRVGGDGDDAKPAHLGKTQFEAGTGLSSRFCDMGIGKRDSFDGPRLREVGMNADGPTKSETSLNPKSKTWSQSSLQRSAHYSDAPRELLLVLINAM
jgi:hypothetical protein